MASVNGSASGGGAIYVLGVLEGFVWPAFVVYEGLGLLT